MLRNLVDRFIASRSPRTAGRLNRLWDAVLEWRRRRGSGRR